MKIEECKSPKILSTCTLDNINSMMLVAEGIVVTKLRMINILNAMVCLLSSYYTFNAEYPKGIAGHS